MDWKVGEMQKYKKNFRLIQSASNNSSLELPMMILTAILIWVINP